MLNVDARRDLVVVVHRQKIEFKVCSYKRVYRAYQSYGQSQAQSMNCVPDHPTDTYTHLYRNQNLQEVPDDVLGGNRGARSSL